MDRIGDYTLLEVLGRGGMGTVYRALAPRGEQVALKVLDRRAGLDAELLLRFDREIEAGRKLDHPGVARVLDAGHAGDTPYLALELLEGPTLAQALQREGPFEPARAVAAIQAVASALGHAHARGVLHRDLKPANVILTARGPVLTDLGLAKLRERLAESLTATGELLGTPAYMAPEQAQAERRAIGPWTDVYGLGATLYALLTGRPPFQGASLVETLRLVTEAPPAPPSALRPGVPPALDAVCLRALAKAPRERYASPGELSAALDEALAGPAARSGWPRSPAHVSRSSRSYPWLGLAGVLLAGSGGVLAAALSGRRPPAATPAAAPDPLAAAQAAFARDDLPAAEASFQAALEAEPDQVGALLGLARCRLESSEPQDRLASEEALRLATRARELAPDDPAPPVVMAAALRRLPERLGEARALLEAVLARHPQHADALLGQAHVTLLGQDSAATVSWLDQAEAAGSDDPSRHLVRGLLLQFRGDHAEAARSLEQYVALRPQRAAGLVYLAASLVGLDRGAEALVLAERASELGPEQAEVWAVRGWVEMLLDQDRQALEHFERALRLHPTHALALDQRPAVLRRLGRNTEAHEALLELTQLRPTYASGWARLGFLEYDERLFDDAVRSLRRALGLDPANPNARRRLADALVQLERSEEAIPELERYLQAPLDAPERVKALLQLGALQFGLRRLDAARETLSEARRLAPGDPRILEALFNLARFTGDAALGQETLEAYVQVEPRRVEAWSDLAQLRLDAGDLDGAASALDEVARLVPSEREVALSQAYVALLLGDRARARAALERVPRAAPSSERAGVEALLTLREGSPQGALERLEGAAADDPVAHYVAGLAHLELGQPDAARARFQAYLAIEPPQHLTAEVRARLRALED